MDKEVGQDDREPENTDGKPEERGYLETLQACLEFRDEQRRKKHEALLARQEMLDIKIK